MEWLLSDFFTWGNVFLAFSFLLILNQLVELYQFRGMPPGPRLKSLPFVGNLLSFDSKAPGKRLLDATKSLRNKSGTVFSLKVGSFKVVFAEDVDSVKEVLVKRSADFAGRPPFSSLVMFTRGGKDIAIGNYGSAWRFHRKLFVSAVRTYLSDQKLVEERISEQAQKLLEYFEHHGGKDFDPCQILTECVANIIREITFAKHFDSSDPEFLELLKLNVGLISNTKLRAETFFLDFFPIAKYLPFSSYRWIKKGSDRIYEILGKQLKEQEKVFDPTAAIGSLTASLLKERIAAVNEVATDENSALLSNDYILSAMLDMFLAGYETTSTTLRWVVAFLVNNPDFQQEMQGQLDEVVGRDRMPGLNDRPGLPLIHAAIMETLRLGNVVEAAIPHYTLNDTTLAGYGVPKDSVVIVNL